MKDREKEEMIIGEAKECVKFSVYPLICKGLD